MNLTVSGIVGGVNDHNSTGICVCANDWAAELTVKASNGILRISIVDSFAIFTCIFANQDEQNQF